MFLEFINKVNISRLITYLTITVLTICPGIIVIYKFDKNLFLAIDWIKLLLLSSSFT